MENKIINVINNEIKYLKKDFATTGEYDTVGNAKIQGMIEILQVVTGKKYYYDNNGLHER